MDMLTRVISPRRCSYRITPLLILPMAAGLLAGSSLLQEARAKVETWRHEGPTAFTRSHRESVVISDNGRVRLGHKVVPTGSIPAARVWDLARAADGSVFAATGDAGQVFRRADGPGASWTVIYDSADSQVLSLVAGPGGALFAGTGPSGDVVNLADPKHPASRPDPKVQYIWDLAADSRGNLFAATGPTGQLWKRAPDARWSLVYDSKATHLLCVALGPDGSVYAGSDGEGLIYRVAPDGKASVVFDAPQSEVRSLLVTPEGTIYAGTAAEAGGQGGARNSLFLSRSEPGRPFDEPGGRTVSAQIGGTSSAVPAAQTPPAGASPPGRARAGQGGSAAPRPVSPGENAVYRLEADGVPREVLRVKALVYALAWSHDRLWVGTGPEGQLYEVRERGEETAPVAKLDSGQILSLLAEPGGLLIGTGDPGGVLRLSAEYAAAGQLVSEVHDTRLMSRFGTLSWRAQQPQGTTVAFQTRTGNVGEPDETWSDWSPEQTSSSAARVTSPPGRFIQYRVKLATTDPSSSPELRSVALSYRTANLAPEIARLDVPDVSIADGTARQTRLNVRWEATDPNDDDLQFTLFVRKEGWPAWIRLNEEPITEKSYSWDTTAFPSGLYRIRLVASDRRSNSLDDVLTRERESTSFLVDHDPPRVRLRADARGAIISLADDLTRIVKAECALDGGPWTPIFPDDTIFDATAETITLPLANQSPGMHILLIRATDAAGNVGTGDLLIEVKGPAPR